MPQVTDVVHFRLDFAGFCPTLQKQEQARRDDPISDRYMQIELRIRNVNLAGSLQSYVERRLRYALRRLGNRLGRVKVWVSDINGPRGGPDKHRRVSLELNPIGTLTAEGTHPDLYVSISGTDSYRRHDIQNRRAGCSLVFAFCGAHLGQPGSEPLSRGGNHQIQGTEHRPDHDARRENQSKAV